MPQAEEMLSDRWVLVEKIDEGAMGEIFSAKHAVLGHSVAVKVLMPTVSRDRAAIDRFLREARIAAKLQHRNVVRVEDFGVATDGRPFLVMELLRGESLARRLARPPHPTNAEVLDLVRQTAAAVDTAHAAGIVHRDLKPENLFLARERDGSTVLKVLDFGVAKFTDTLANGGNATASNTLIGTPRYMSPEQARSLRELDGRSDLWSLGMIAYEMLTGSHPFEGEAIAELLVAILTHRIPPPTALRADLPLAVDAWAERALARSRYERFATGAELADALASALDGRLDDRWTPTSYERHRPSDPRGGTVRVRRPTPVTDGMLRARRATPMHDVAPPMNDALRSRPGAPAPSAEAPVAAPLKLTPPEGPSPLPPAVTAAPAPSAEPVVDTPRDTPDVPAPSPSAEQSQKTRALDAPRSSWWIAAVAALVAGLGLVAAIRQQPGASNPTASPAAALLAPSNAPATPAVTAPRPSNVAPSAASDDAPDAAVRAPAVPAAVASSTDDSPRHGGARRRRGHTHRTRLTHGAESHAPASSAPRGSLYDPTGI